MYLHLYLLMLIGQDGSVMWPETVKKQASNYFLKCRKSTARLNHLVKVTFFLHCLNTLTVTVF